MAMRLGVALNVFHNSELQQKIFECLKHTPEEIENKFGFFLEALSYGTPPHLGIALGLDRLIMILTKPTISATSLHSLKHKKPAT